MYPYLIIRFASGIQTVVRGPSANKISFVMKFVTISLVIEVTFLIFLSIFVRSRCWDYFQCKSPIIDFYFFIKFLNILFL
jgi:hypothetical protein